MTKPKLLFIAHRIPYPPTKGEKLRAFNLLKGLAAHYDVTLGAPVDDPDDWHHRDALAPWCFETYFADIRGRTRQRAAFEAIAKGEPVSYAYFRQREMMNWVSTKTSEQQFDAVFVYSSGAAPYLKAIRRAPDATIIDFVDVDSEKWKALAETSKGPMRAIYAREARLLAAEEARLGNLADASLLVTDAEAALFSKITGVFRSIATVGNGVDTDYWGASRSIASPYETDGTARIIFTGVMDYEPNVDAVCWFAEEALPHLRARRRDVEFVIAGGRPAKAVEALAEQPDIRVTGRVEDMRGWLGHADLAVAPLRIARGVQNKVLEAMAARTPILTSIPALTGIDALPGTNAVTCETGIEFADGIVNLLDDPGRREAMAASAQAFVTREYSWPSKVETLRTIIEAARAKTAVSAA